MRWADLPRIKMAGHHLRVERGCWWLAIGVERKGKMLKEAATLVSESLSEFYENLRQHPQHPQQSTKKPFSTFKGQVKLKNQKNSRKKKKIS
jgi:hypothetical protein